MTIDRGAGWFKLLRGRRRVKKIWDVGEIVIGEGREASLCWESRMVRKIRSWYKECEGCAHDVRMELALVTYYYTSYSHCTMFIMF